jgi:hypothetical protein
VRATFALVPGRLLLTFVGTLPTGTKALPDSTLPLFTILATDLFDFTTPSFGSGGGVTGGVATATRWGSWAVGGGASLRYSGSYEPVAGGGELKPGNEARARLGAEGPLGGNYLRLALLYTLSQHDEMTGGSPSVSGDRVLFYSHLSMPLGRSSLSLYGFDMYRMRARKFNTTATSVVEVPRGNVLALGARLEHALSPRATLAPSVELRHELTEQADSSLAPLGLIVRPGVDLRYRVSGPAALVLQAQVPVGYVKDQGATYSLIGPRLSAMLEWTH